MSYIQYIIQAGNTELFHNILMTDEGTNDFMSSRDIYDSTCLHYIALFDLEDFLGILFTLMNGNIQFSLKLK